MSNPKRQKQPGVRKRAPNACGRCRQQKIKCIGPPPCEQCTKRNLTCSFDDKSQKVLVTRRFIDDLEERIAALDRPQGTRAYNLSGPDIDPEDHEEVTDSDDEVDPWIDATESTQRGSNHPISSTRPQEVPISSSPSSEPQLMNPLALGASAYVPDTGGSPVYLGPSSNWSFGRRVLSMTHESLLGVPLSPENLLFQGEVYDLGWDGQRPPESSANLGPGGLPSPDFAMYLINAVKFHCSQMFHLFDEESFMERFSQFHDSSADKSTLYPLWYVHYLLILAFGKAFVARTNKGRRPPGAELFVQAMKLLPDITFSCKDPVETTEIFCCAALYLQSLDFRSAAYRLIGQALRIALEQGMHTDMESQHVQESHTQRCRKIWWTVYMLDRQMSSLMGLPFAIRDEDISAGLPSFSQSAQKATALTLHVKLSRVLAQIFNSVYGAEARWDQLFMNNTKAALKSIADATDQLNSNFELSVNGTMAGISRVSAYLHLLHHQCIILATRPLLFRFLEMRLGSRQGKPKYPPRSGNVRALLQMCIDSAQQMLKVLAALQEQGLLESFLPFDLNATSASAMVILMAATIDPSLLENHAPWSQRAYAILQEMSSRGNLVAGFLESELQQLDANLSRVSSIGLRSRSTRNNASRSAENDRVDASNNTHPSAASYPQTLTGSTMVGGGQRENSNDNYIFGEEFFWQDQMTTEQLMALADSLDLEGMNWLSPSVQNSQISPT